MQPVSWRMSLFCYYITHLLFHNSFTKCIVRNFRDFNQFYRIPFQFSVSGIRTVLEPQVVEVL